MNKPFLAVIGRVDVNTTEEVIIKEIVVNARDYLEAHKIALFKCNCVENETVFEIKDYNTKTVLFHFKTGFRS